MKKSLFKVVVLLLTFLWSNTTFSQFNETIRADRPGEALTPFSVGARVLQVQAGLGYLKYSKLDYELSDAGTSVVGNSFLSSLVVRMGLTERFELSAGMGYTNGKIENTFFSTNEDGISALSFGLRSTIFVGEGWIPSVGFLVDFGLPWLSGEYDSRYIRPSFALLTNQRMGEKFGLTTNWGLLWNGDVASPFAKYVINVSYDINAKLSVFLEPYGYIQEGLWEPHIDGGAGYLITNNLQLDLSAGYGAGENEYRDWFIIAGVSWRIRFKEKHMKNDE